DELGPKLQDINDGTSATLMLVEAGTPVPWTKPEDLSYDPEKPFPKLGRQFDDGFYCAFPDGSVRYFGNAIAPRVVRQLITRSGSKPTAVDPLNSDPPADE